jgi:hypothetical protein
MVVMPVISALWRLRQENLEFKASPGYKVRPCLQKQKQRRTGLMKFFEILTRIFIFLSF